MDALFLLKPGELMLKGANRPFFMRTLRRNLKAMMKGVPHILEDRHCRLFLRTAEDNAAETASRLRRFIGISGFARTLCCAKEMHEIEKIAALVVEANLAAGKGTGYKIDVTRSDKKFPLDSYGLACELGNRLGRRFPGLSVRLRDPAWILNVEIRDDVYCYSFAEEGERGLPVGVGGKGLLLLSGGIDSPVAGYMMAKRGLRLDAVHFHSYPYTSRQAREKAESLAGILADRAGRLDLYVVPFTDVLVRIRERAPEDETTLLSRACMMRIADKLAFRRDANSLVAGESLSQVASQTAESIRFTGSFASLPVFRPLVGLDKEHIIRTARRIGSYETSILPYEDCCSVFSHRHPVIRPKFSVMRKSYEGLEIDEMLRAALKNAELVRFGE